MRRSTPVYIWLAAAFVALCLGCIVHAQDSGGHPRRIISLGPAITEELYLLGVGDRIIGVTNYCLRPTEALRKEKIGTVREANVEKIVDLRPDLVIGTSLTDPSAIKKLRSLGIEVKVVPQPKDFAQLCQRLAGLGSLVGREKEAQEIVCRTEKEIRMVEEKVKDLPRVRVFVQVGAKPLVTAGRGVIIDNLIELAGGINIAGNSGEASYMPYSREKVIKADPDCIIIVTMGIAGEEEKKKWGSFENLKAVRDKRIYVVDSYNFCSPTPVTFVEALKEIAAIMHPDTDWSER